jgi:hypothetical protein
MHHHAGHVGYSSPGTQIDLITPDFEARSGRFKVPAGVPTCETEEHRENLCRTCGCGGFSLDHNREAVGYVRNLRVRPGRVDPTTIVPGEAW